MSTLAKQNSAETSAAVQTLDEEQLALPLRSTINSRVSISQCFSQGRLALNPSGPWIPTYSVKLLVLFHLTEALIVWQ